MSPAEIEQKKMIVSAIATGTVTSMVGAVGFISFIISSNVSDIHPWAIINFVLYAIDITYMTIHSRAYLAERAKDPEYVRQRSLKPRREQAKLNSL